LNDGITPYHYLPQILPRGFIFDIFQYNIQKGVIAAQGSNYFSFSIETHLEALVLYTQTKRSINIFKKRTMARHEKINKEYVSESSAKVNGTVAYTLRVVHRIPTQATKKRKSYKLFRIMTQFSSSKQPVNYRVIATDG
jgi:hypothetical protein